MSSTIDVEPKNDFDFINDTITINKKMFYRGQKSSELKITNQMKSQSSRSVIPLVNELKKILIEWFKENPYDVIITNDEGNYIHPDILINKLAKISKKLGFQFNFHMCRHTLATNLVLNDVRPEYTQSILCHANYATTVNLYTHLKKENLKNSLDDIFKIQKCGENDKLEK